MLSKDKIDYYCKNVIELLNKAQIVITKDEKDKIEIAEFGLGRFEEIGLAIITYVNNERYCAKELIMFPWMICPEHKHPPVENDPGKMETFRCRWGKVYLYTEGEPTRHPKAKIPEDKKDYFTVWHEIELHPGEQYTLPPNTLHWFQAGEDGAIISEFSSTSRDESDIFTDPFIIRVEKG
ncbi:MAG: D-lyxose/D-mannose family sugar isomerase [Candidatus Hydrogenedens sp.]|nr:D-lyxose/D-mannose family sugar isomerase [Candidatus Hydrogenedens sp.]